MKIKYSKEEYLQKRKELVECSLKINHLLDYFVIPEDVLYGKFLIDLEEYTNQLVGLLHWFEHDPFISETEPVESIKDKYYKLYGIKKDWI